MFAMSAGMGEGAGSGGCLGGWITDGVEQPATTNANERGSQFDVEDRHARVLIFRYPS